jgi:hypothetical protein
MGNVELSGGDAAKSSFPKSSDLLWGSARLPSVFEKASQKQLMLHLVTLLEWCQDSGTQAFFPLVLVFCQFVCLDLQRQMRKIWLRTDYVLEIRRQMHRH